MLDYDLFLQNSKRYMIREILKQVADEGLSSENHFLISFRTNREDVLIPDFVRAKYPEEITIILQHQFENLIVNDTFFEVDLAFGGVHSTLRIPYTAITQFGDPSQNFGFLLTPQNPPKKQKNKDINESPVVIDLEKYRKK